MSAALAQLAQAAKSVGKPVLADSGETPVWFKIMLEEAGAKVQAFTNPVVGQAHRQDCRRSKRASSRRISATAWRWSGS